MRHQLHRSSIYIFQNSSSFENYTDNNSITDSPVTLKVENVTSSSPYTESTLYSGGKYLLSRNIRFKESDIRDNDSELYYDTDRDLEVTCSSASDITYLCENSSFCDNSVVNSTEKVSVSSDNTFVNNISSNEPSTETSSLTFENTFATDCLETSLLSGDVTDRYDFSNENKNKIQM